MEAWKDKARQRNQEMACDLKWMAPLFWYKLEVKRKRQRERWQCIWMNHWQLCPPPHLNWKYLPLWTVQIRVSNEVLHISPIIIIITSSLSHQAPSSLVSLWLSYALVVISWIFFLYHLLPFVFTSWFGPESKFCSLVLEETSLKMLQ